MEADLDGPHRASALPGFVARGGVGPPTFRFSGPRSRIHPKSRTSLSCNDAGPRPHPHPANTGG